jgi:hypothetical protein
MLLAAGCVANPSGAESPSSAPAVSASAVASPSPAVAKGNSLNAAAVSTSATPGAAPAAIDVSPAEAQLGSLTLSLTIEPARHMLDQTVAPNGDHDPAHQAAASTTNGSTAVVLNGLLKLTNNLDPSQPLPDDAPQSMLRHVNVQIDNVSGSAVPYLTASMDLLLDGHPVISNLALLPMVGVDDTTPQLYYGNNVKLTQLGTYQAFVRLQPNPLVGKDPLPTAQFNMVVH